MTDISPYRGLPKAEVCSRKLYFKTFLETHKHIIEFNKEDQAPYYCRVGPIAHFHLTTDSFAIYIYKEWQRSKKLKTSRKARNKLNQFLRKIREECPESINIELELGSRVLIAMYKENWRSHPVIGATNTHIYTKEQNDARQNS